MVKRVAPSSPDRGLWVITTSSGAAGLDVSDRITLRWSAGDPQLAQALTEHAGLISSEVLAVSFAPDSGGPDGSGQNGPGHGDAGPDGPPAGRGEPWHEYRDEALGLAVWLHRTASTSQAPALNG